MVARSVLIGRDKNLPIDNLGAVKEVLAFGDANGCGAGFQVLQVQLSLRPSLRYRDKQPAIVVGKLGVRPVLRITACAENQRIFSDIGAERVIEDVAVVNFLAICNLAFLRIARVIKT